MPPFFFVRGTQTDKADERTSGGYVYDKPVIFFEDFVLYAALAGVCIALAAGPLGCFVVWRRMAYFGDATAHAAILGVALALAFDAPIIVGVLITAIAMAILVSVARGTSLAVDTLLGVAAHSSLAIGLVAVSLTPGRRIDLEAYLFGDILSLTRSEVGLISFGCLVILVIIIWRWNEMLTAILNRDLAVAEGKQPDRERLLLSLILAVFVAVSLKIVGALLITAILIIPAASARVFAQTPERMAGVASFLGGVSVLSGLAVSIEVDTAAGPTIIAVATFIFLTAQSFSALFKKHWN